MTILKSTTLALSALVISGCGGGGGSSEEPLKSAIIDFDVFGNGVGTNKSAKITFEKSLHPTSITINSIKANNCEGEATFSPSTFELSDKNSVDVSFSIKFDEDKKCISDKIIVKYTKKLQDNLTIQEEKTIPNPTYSSLHVSTQNEDDPLYKYQWHLKNTAQQAGVTTQATLGEDIDVEDVWAKNITGDGVKVAVIDEGVDMFHLDLKDNLIMHLSHNYHTGSNNPTPIRYYAGANNEGYYDPSHGTAVAGLIAAKGWNGIGTRGVAPNAKLVSYNALEIIKDEASELYKKSKIPHNYTDMELLHYRSVDALNRNLDEIDIYNNSWGSSKSTLNYNIEKVNYEKTLKYGISNGRQGKGAIYVKSSGNNPNSWSNLDPMQSNGYMIVVGASGADGKFSSYSTKGPNILVNAPGGGEGALFVKPDVHRIVTTDLAGKQRGYDSDIVQLSNTSHFDVAGNENYDYTNLMNGTSAAAPIVSGVVALMLQKDSSLTYADVRYILAKSAFKNDPTDSGWKQNGAGLNYHYAYGFGRVNAKNAISMLDGYEKLGATKIANNTEKNATKQINDNFKIQHVKVSIKSLKAQSEYKEYNLTKSDDKFIYLFKGDSIFDVNTTFMPTEQIDMNIENELGEIVKKVKISDQHKVNLTINIKEASKYKIKIDKPQWSLHVRSKYPKFDANETKIILTSPQNTQSLLVNAPNDLEKTQEYNNTILGSFEFMDENSNGIWTLKAQDLNKNEIALDEWELEIVGH